MFSETTPDLWYHNIKLNFFLQNELNISKVLSFIVKATGFDICKVHLLYLV